MLPAFRMLLANIKLSHHLIIMPIPHTTIYIIRERRPEHRTRNGTGTERERTGTRTREMLVQHLRHSRLPSAFLAAGKMQMAMRNGYLLLVQHLRHSRLPSAFLAAGKNADGNARGRTICILSRPQNANEIFVKTVT